MAIESELHTEELDHVRIPAALCRELDEFLSSLKLRILVGAARAANTRTGKRKPCHVRAEDVVHWARSAFKTAALELEDDLSQSHHPHARRNAS